MTDRHPGLISLLLSVLLLFVADQVTKYLAALHVPLNSTPFSFLGFGLTLKLNSGFIFHIGEQYRYTLVISIVVKIILFPLIIFAYRFYGSYFRKSRLMSTSFILVLAGLLGNLCDSVFLGYVRDFILWPGPGTPNLADVFVTTSIVLLLLEVVANPQIDNRSLFRLESPRQTLCKLRVFVDFAKQEIQTLLS